jgi:hypothetical protein
MLFPYLCLTPVSGGYERSGFQKSWRSGFQICGNERTVYTALSTGCQFGIRRGARSFQLRDVLIKQNENFEKSQESKGLSEKF